MIQQLLGDIENVTTDTVFKRLLTQAQMSNSSIESESTVAFNAQQANKSKSKADSSRVLPERTSNAKDALCTYPGHQYSLHSNGNCIAQNSKSSQDKSKSKNDVKSKPIGTLSDADKVRLFDKAASKATSDAATANAAVAMAALSTNKSGNEDIIELTTAYSLIASDPISQSTDMYIDSGTNRDIFKTCEKFSELHSIFPVCIRSANGSDSLVATQAGTVSIDTYDEKNRVCHASIEDVLYCPEVAVNLISVSRLCDGGFSLHADADSMSFINSNGQKLYATRTAHSLELWAARVSINSSCGHSSIPISTSRTSSFNASADLMHQRLGHLHSAALRRFCLTHDLTKTCTSCILAKSHRHPFPSKLPQLSRILFRVHSDVVGPIQTLTCSGKKYFVTFIDEASRFNKVYLISKKSDVFECFRSYVAYAERYTGQKLCILKSDRGGEYRSSRFLAFATTHGITIEQGPAKTPQHNGVAERFNRTLMERVRAQMVHANLPKKLWGEVVMATSHILNLSPSSVINSSPHDVWHDAAADSGSHRSDVKFLRVIGCASYVHSHHDERRKLDNTSVRKIFVGYEPGAKAYRLYDMDSGVISISRDVTFIETVFPFRHHQHSSSTQPAVSSIDDFWFPDPDDSLTSAESSSTHSPSPPVIPAVSTSDSPIQSPALRPLQLRPVRSKASVQRFGNLRTYAARVSRTYDPDNPTYEQAMKNEDRSHWEVAMDDEWSSFVKHRVGRLVKREKRMNVIGGMWRLK